MNTESITVSVDPAVAAAYRSATSEERRKLDLLVNLRLLEATSGNDSLVAVMRDLTRRAVQQGLTPDTLQSLLDEH